MKEKIENSYLNTADTSTKTETIDEIVESVEVYELSESTVQMIFSQIFKIFFQLSNN